MCCSHGRPGKDSCWARATRATGLYLANSGKVYKAISQGLGCLMHSPRAECPEDDMLDSVWPWSSSVQAVDRSCCKELSDAWAFKEPAEVSLWRQVSGVTLSDPICLVDDGPSQLRYDSVQPASPVSKSLPAPASCLPRLGIRTLSLRQPACGCTKAGSCWSREEYLASDAASAMLG